MGVVITNSMVVGRLNAGRLRPKKPGDIDAPNQLTAEQAQQIAEANNITPQEASELSGPDLIQAISASGLSAPNQISAEQASQLQAARELDALSAASIAAPNQINAIPDSTSPPFDMRHARILYENKLTDAGQNPALTSENTYESAVRTAIVFEMPENRDVDTIALLGDFSGTSITVQYSTTTGGSFVTVASLTPSNNRPIMALFDEVSARRVRVGIGDSEGRRVINVSAGISLQMQRPIFGGHNPITMSRQTEYQSRRSESGNFVSRNIIRKGLSGSYEWSNLTDDWVREYFDPFIIAARKVPFYIAWRPESYPDEVAYAWTTGDISPNNIGTRNLMSVGMDVQAYGD